MDDAVPPRVAEPPSLLPPKKKNRNKKGLALIGDPPPTYASSSVASTAPRATPGATAPHRAAPSRPAPIQVASRAGGYRRELSEQVAALEWGVEFKLDLKSEDLVVRSELGSGNGGTVSRCEHVPTGVVMAKKVSSSFVYRAAAARQLLSVKALTGGGPGSCVFPGVCTAANGHGALASSCRSFTLQPRNLLGSRLFVNCKSCTTATRRSSCRSTAPSFKTRTSACAWSSWTKGACHVFSTRRRRTRGTRIATRRRSAAADFPLPSARSTTFTRKSDPSQPRSSARLRLLS